MSLRIRFAIGMAVMLLPLVLAVAVGHFYFLRNCTGLPSKHSRL